MILLKLMWVFFQVGLLSFGGGLSCLLTIKQLVVDKHAWLTIEQFTDIITISEMTPGPMALNAATFVGTQVGGFAGAVLATVAFIFPCFILVLLLAKLFFRFKSVKGVVTVVDTLKPSVVSFIGAAGVSVLLLAFFGTDEWSKLSIGSLSWVSVCIFAVSLVLLLKFKKLSPIAIIIGSGAIGVLIYSFFPQLM